MSNLIVASCQMPYVEFDIPQTVALILEYAARAEAKGAEIVCFTECFLQGYILGQRARQIAINLSSSEFLLLETPSPCSS